MAKMAALHARLRSFMRCWGKYCFNPPIDPPPAPTPPPPPLPPPSPAPPGLVQFEDEATGYCLTCTECKDAHGHVPLIMEPCANASSRGYAPSQVWKGVFGGRVGA